MWERALAASLALACAPGCKGHSAAPAPPRAGSANVRQVEQALAKIVATCAEATGTVEARREGDPRWGPIGVGAVFREHDWVRTGDHAYARLRFVAGGFLELREDTTILVDTAIHVDTGALVAVAEAGKGPLVVRAADGSEARIEAAAGGPNAEVRLTPSGASGLEIAVTGGAATVTTRAGARTIAAGEASQLAGGTTTDTVKLLPFPHSLLPGVDARFHYESGKAMDLSWTKVAGAARYHVQVARDTDFHVLVLEADTAAPRVSFSPDEAGMYVWRAAAVDAAGHVGELGFARRMYFEDAPPRDLLLAPADGAKIGFSTHLPAIAFSWQSASETAKYRLAISTGSDPAASPVASIVTTRQQVVLRSLGEGDYHWGVYAVKDGQDTPIFLAPRTLAVRRHRVKPKTDKLWTSGAH